MTHRRLAILVSAALLIAGLRLAHIVSQSECGWSFVLTQWQDASLGFVGLGHTRRGHSAPAEQAQFWLNEVERVVDEQPHSASLHMGSAWLLDSPENGFLQDHVRQSEFASVFPQMGIEIIDEEAISKAKAEFRDACQDRCLEMAERSTINDPADVRWWRMRALLLFEGDSFYSGKDFEPRSNEWLRILDECREHDPENALYNYLAALQLWNTSASYDWPAEPEEQSDGEEWMKSSVDDNVESDLADELEEQDEYWILTVHDPALFAEGLKRFLSAQRLPYLAVGEAGYPSVSEFLSNSRLRKTDQVDFAVSRLVTFRHSTLLHRLWRWQNVRADEARKASDNQAEIDILLQSLRFYDQAIVPAETSALTTLTTFGVLRRHTYERIVKLSTADPATIASDDLDAIKKREEKLRIATATLDRALRTLDEGTYPKEYSSSWEAVLSTVACVSASVLFLIAGILVLLRRMLGPCSGEASRFGVWRHVVSWSVACGFTFVALGMAPAEVISHGTQRTIIVCCIWLLAACFTAAAIWFVVQLTRLRKLRFRLRTLFASMTGAAVFSALWPLMSASFDGLAQYPPELWIHAKGWNGIDAEVLRNAMQLEKGSWSWSVMQWFVHGGQYVGLVAALLLTVAWYTWRSASQLNQGVMAYSTSGKWWRRPELFHFAGRAALGAALCWFFLYLIVAPGAVALAEAEFQHKMRYCRNPEAHWTEIQNAQAAVESSIAEMDGIRETVDFELFGKGTLERDFSSE